MARNPPSQERLHLQPAAPLPSAMGKGKRKMTIDEYEEDRLSNNAKKPPTEGLLYLQPSTPMPLTPAPLPQAPLPLSPLGGSLMATNATQMDFAPMEVPVDAPMEVPVDAPMDAQLEVPMDAPMEAPIDEVMRRDFQPILTRRQIAQRARRQREQGARILDNTQPLSRRQRQQCSRNDNTQRNLTSYTPPPSTPVLNTPSQSYSQRHESPIITSSYTPIWGSSI